MTIKQKLRLLGSALLGAFFVCIQITQANNNLIVNEIMYDLPGSDDKHEWVEIFNPTSNDIDLKDWKINDGSNHLLNEPPKNSGQGSLIIAANSYAILADDAATFLIDYPTFTNTIIDTVLSLKNASGTIQLINSENQIIDEVNYENTWGGAGNGKSLEKIDHTSDNNQNNWSSSQIDGGTPGTENSNKIQDMSNINEENATSTPKQTATSTPEKITTTSFSAPGGDSVNLPPKAEIKISPEQSNFSIDQEISFDASQSSDPDSDTLNYLWNFGDGATDTNMKCKHSYQFSGRYIISLIVSDKKEESTQTIPINIYQTGIFINEFIPSPEGKDEENEWIELYNGNEKIVDISNWQIDDAVEKSKPFILPKNTFIYPKQYLVFTRLITKVALNNDKDSVRLIYPNSVVAEEIKYSKTKEGWSVIKNGEEYVWTSTPTPGSTNILEQREKNQPENKQTNNPQYISQVIENPILPSLNLSEDNIYYVKESILETEKSKEDLSSIGSEASKKTQNPQTSPNQESDIAKNNFSEYQASFFNKIKSKKPELILFFSIILSAGFLGFWLVLIKRKRIT